MNRIRVALDARRRAGTEGDAGFTLVEMLIAMSIFMTLTAILMSSVLSSARGVKNSREYNDLNEEARLLLNRMSRELREATRITAATNPAGTSFATTGDGLIRFEVDFNGNGIIEPFADDPEELTYSYDNAANRVTLQAAGENFPILAANVSFFRLSYTSRRWQHDYNKDSVVTWEELDADPSGSVGNKNGQLDQELGSIDSITIEVSVLTGSRRQDYRTQVDLRNRPN